jgi:hypothetical protein
MTETEDVDPLEVRKPPEGLTRAERRVWQEAEAVRVADVRDQSRTGGIRSVLATTPPKGLGRSGRRAWREADRDNRSRRMQAEAAGSESDRYVGAMVLMVIIGVVIALRVVFSGGSDEPSPAPSSPPVVTYQATPTAAPSQTAVPPRGE